MRNCARLSLIPFYFGVETKIISRERIFRMLKIFLVLCVLLCITTVSVNSFRPDPAHVNDCYHPIIFKYIAVNQTIQTGRCSIATCKAAPFDIEETLCECGPRTIYYKSGCYEGLPDNTKDYPDCCERPRICV